MKANLRTLVPALCATLVLASCASRNEVVQTEEPYYGDNSGVVEAPAPPAIPYTYAPRWELVSGTDNVYLVSSYDRPDFDYFRVGSGYYVYQNGYWYRSSHWNGPYAAITWRGVPTSLRSVPRREWVSYPADWNDRYDRYGRSDRYGPYGSGRASEPLQVTFRHEPKWNEIGETHVYVPRPRDRINLDVFRYRRMYYAYDGNYWYAAGTWRGPYGPLDDRNVPRALMNVPRNLWVNYPVEFERGGYSNR